jgi:hypothetical protein
MNTVLSLLSPVVSLQESAVISHSSQTQSTSTCRKTHEQAILRIEKAKQDCRDLLKSGNVALVGHHVFFQRFTEGVGRGYITLANCEILKFNLEDT